MQEYDLEPNPESTKRYMHSTNQCWSNLATFMYFFNFEDLTASEKFADGSTLVVLKNPLQMQSGRPVLTDSPKNGRTSVTMQTVSISLVGPL